MAYQICTNNSKWLIDSFTDATCKPYGYLVLDHHPSTPEKQRVVTNILPGEQLTYYIKSNAQVRRNKNYLMGNTKSKFKRKFNNLKVVKRYIKFHAVALDLKVIRAVIKKAHERVHRRHLQRGAQRPPGRRSHSTTPESSL